MDYLMLAGLAKKLIVIGFKVPGWVKDAQAAHGSADGTGPAKLKEVTQKALDCCEAEFGDVPDSWEPFIVAAVSYLVDQALDMFKKDGDPAFSKSR